MSGFWGATVAVADCGVWGRWASGMTRREDGKEDSRRRNNLASWGRCRFGGWWSGVRNNSSVEPGSLKGLRERIQQPPASSESPTSTWQRGFKARGREAIPVYPHARIRPCQCLACCFMLLPCCVNQLLNLDNSMTLASRDVMHFSSSRILTVSSVTSATPKAAPQLLGVTCETRQCTSSWLTVPRTCELGNARPCVARA